ncbi:MAG: GGDEF domain-containing protein [Dehalococcoidia bacterium]|nr:GGDEF domain-containing protein [Dehalococcoidia bacterium]
MGQYVLGFRRLAGLEFKSAKCDREETECKATDCVLNVTDRQGGQPFDERDLATLNLMASHLALCVEVGALHDQIRQMADTDGLTGVRNHRYFQERLGRETERATRFGQPLSLVMIDVNGLKDFNDERGHRAGDAVLKEVARALEASVRQIDLVSRYGGDEFTVLLPETDMVGARRAARRIIQTLEANKAVTTSIEGFEAITLSLGVSSYPAPASSKLQLLEQADSAMYCAKRGLPPHICCWRNTSEAETSPVAPGLLPAYN